ncbi:protein SMALL AUXIN UP-REGULATED RNA 9-like [Euphorbia lathyris]|uniref:protein SMALL AUXIN UP-REGULATED RNA 9-like n=1 Tax=Euphorbia lathyris TaxID=212925 RepID=UPI003313B5E8
MDSKKSNKIRDIVRLQQILKKWRKQATSSSSKTKESIKFLKRTLSISENLNSASSNVVPKGFLAVSVGEELKRFIIPMEYLGHQAFHVLLREAEEEFGFQQTGVLRIPCEVGVFETILKVVEEKKDVNDCRLFGISAANSPLCSSSSSQHTPSHHPQSPMCR